MNIYVNPHVPPPGSTSAGDLYVDLQSRTMWLGVDEAVDPAGAVLLSDIVGTDAAIDQTLLDAKSYTDTGVATRAPTVHTHTSSQITDFTPAVQAIIGPSGAKFARGMIMMFSGSLATIGTGDLAGWALCDGSNGTPDLRDKFILGAGNRPTGVPNTGDSFNTTAGGAHDHAINATAISIAQMPSHDHTPGTGGESVDHAHYISGTTDSQGNHNHQIPIWNGQSGRLDGPGGNGVASIGTYTLTEPGGVHGHNINFWSGGRNTGHTHAIYAQGGNQGHTHTTVSGGGLHQHTITGAQMREALPYLTLAYIMKL
jgi:hypothetical protein